MTLKYFKINLTPLPNTPYFYLGDHQVFDLKTVPCELSSSDKKLIPFDWDHVFAGFTRTFISKSQKIKGPCEINSISWLPVNHSEIKKCNIYPIGRDGIIESGRIFTVPILTGVLCGQVDRQFYYAYPSVAIERNQLLNPDFRDIKNIKYSSEEYIEIEYLGEGVNLENWIKAIYSHGISIWVDRKGLIKAFLKKNSKVCKLIPDPVIQLAGHHVYNRGSVYIQYDKNPQGLPLPFQTNQEAEEYGVSCREFIDEWFHNRKSIHHDGKILYAIIFDVKNIQKAQRFLPFLKGMNMPNLKRVNIDDNSNPSRFSVSLEFLVSIPNTELTVNTKLTTAYVLHEELSECVFRNVKSPLFLDGIGNSVNVLINDDSTLNSYTYFRKANKWVKSESDKKYFFWKIRANGALGKINGYYYLTESLKNMPLAKDKQAGLMQKKERIIAQYGVLPRGWKKFSMEQIDEHFLILNDHSYVTNTSEIIFSHSLLKLAPELSVEWLEKYVPEIFKISPISGVRYYPNKISFSSYLSHPKINELYYSFLDSLVISTDNLQSNFLILLAFVADPEGSEIVLNYIKNTEYLPNKFSMHELMDFMKPLSTVDGHS